MLSSSSLAKPSPSRDKGEDREESQNVIHSTLAPLKASSPRHSPKDASHSHTRAKPPSPPPPNESAPPLSPSKIPNFKSRFGWQFPQQNRTPLPPLELEKDAPLLPEPRAPSPVRLLNSRIPTVASGSAHAVKPASPATENSHTTAQSHRKKGHKRSSTEFSEAVGRIPPKIEVHDEVDMEPIPIVSRDEQEAITSSPSLSTPLAKPVALPQDTPQPSTQSPGSNDTQHSVPISDGIQPSSPSVDATPPAFTLQTPPRKPSLHTSRLEFKTPSPPRNMPDLPGPPSSSDAEEDDDRTPVNRSDNIIGNFSNMKTPRPPGAWANTPLPPSRSLDLFPRPNSTPPYCTPSPLATTPAHPLRAATMSRADSLPPQTPAPPGAWLNTPAANANSARRKSILKVRFDIDPGELSSDVSMFESTPPPAKAQVRVAPAPAIPSIPNAPPPSTDTESDGKVQVHADVTPKRESPKSLSVRLVDAYGRETVMMDAPSSPLSMLDTPHRNNGDFQTSTPRSKSAIRIVDAMGREVEEPPSQVQEVKVEDKRIVRGRRIAVKEEEEDNWAYDAMSHNEALARVRETIKDLATDLDEVDRTYDDLALDENRLSTLEDASRAARSARKRITDSLRYVQSAEDDLRQKFGSLRKGMNESRLLPSTRTDSGASWARINTWTVCIFLVIQVVLMVLMYQYSSARTRKMFLTTYYDGFNVDLYLHLTSPSTLRRSIPSVFSWSVLSVPETVASAGWKSAVGELWDNVTTLVVEWAMPTSSEGNGSWQSWPPT
ncbi:hypothetical protein EUX98_g3785 [Antrodiella citrinella]|uniref:Uncharacterized protein n=1 Tax=Antrodiella citrinella TaxID=2447956 RepID=A0A4S4MVP9_9APHY|nr:hypothetical protein EUX98_g3785 [Antrodiella citrinella]